MISLLLVALAAAVLAAAVTDLVSYTIPNTLVLAVLAGFPLFAFAAGLGWTDTGWHVGLALLVLLLGLAMFARGWLGGGDAKLAAALALWYGPHLAFLDFLTISGLVGAVLGLAILGFRRVKLPSSLSRSAWLQAIRDPAKGVPYGVAFAAGVLATISHLPN